MSVTVRIESFSLTRLGYTARWILKFRPPTHIFAVTSDPRVMRQLRMLWGVHPVQYVEDLDYVDELVKESVRVVHEAGFVRKGKDIVFTSGTKLIPGRMNLLGVFHVSDLA